MEDKHVETILNKAGLSGCESRVAKLVIKGLRNKEVADKLEVSEKTVKFHLSSIYRKLEIQSRAQLIVWALKNEGFE